jgi:hypothetical protein
MGLHHCLNTIVIGYLIPLGQFNGNSLPQHCFVKSEVKEEGDKLPKRCVSHINPEEPRYRTNCVSGAELRQLKNTYRGLGYGHRSDTLQTIEWKSTLGNTRFSACLLTSRRYLIRCSTSTSHSLRLFVLLPIKSDEPMFSVVSVGQYHGHSAPPTPRTSPNLDALVLT